jgi:heme-degrading monooxygenase HmoA
MFIAMNRFRVKKGSEEAFEKVWLSRDSQLAKVPGFVEFRLLKGTRARGFYALCLPLGLAEQGDV